MQNMRGKLDSKTWIHRSAWFFKKKKSDRRGTIRKKKEESIKPVQLSETNEVVTLMAQIILLSSYVEPKIYIEMEGTKNIGNSGEKQNVQEWKR